MSDLAATLWTAFAEESADHLSAAAALLAGPPRRDDVGALFRAFHSLKGLARAMSRHGMEAVASHAEGLLGLVRDHGAAMDDDMLAALSDALGTLRLQRDEAVMRQDDEPPPAATIARLQQAIATASTALEARAAASGGALADGGNGSDATLSTDATGLGEDSEMLLLFAETLQLRLPELAGVLSATEAQREDLADAIDSLIHAAGVMEMEALVDLLRQIADTFAGRALPLDAAGRQAQSRQLWDLADRAALLEEMLGVEAGAAVLAAALRAAGERDGETDFPLGLATALRALSVAIAASDGSVADRARAAVEALAPARAAQPETADLLALLGDVCPRLAAGMLPAMRPLADVLAAVAEAGDRGTITLEAGTLAADLHAIVAAPASDDGDADSLLSATVRVDDPLVQALGRGAWPNLAARLAAGEHAYGITLFLEEAPVLAEQLIGWLSGAGTLLTNRSVFVENVPWFEMLLVSSLVPNALHAELLDIDPDQACLRALRELYPVGAVAHGAG
ncbi:MAG TPA: Hpt domain-containing protein [Rhodopila sp.]|nr:Hpt domain-containing protein [Rhodopila sp.]